MSDPTIAVSILTFNMFSTGRDEYFWRAYHGYRDGGGLHALTVVTTGSSDGTSDVVADLGGIDDPGPGSAGRGMTLAIEAALATGASHILFSADDVVPVRDWIPRLRAFWREADVDIKLATLFIEPMWDWNAIDSAATIGGERVLFRASIPGSSWSFRAADWPLIGPIAHTTGGEDLTVCKRLRANGYRLAALDLAEHAGARASAWGNRSYEYERPLNRPAWGLPATIGGVR